jgi:superfamily II DNA or RNA helicase
MREYTNLRVARYRGKLAVPTPNSFDAVVATPGAVLGQERVFKLHEFGMVIFDELHHVVKNHPYRAIAQRLQALCTSVRPKILGLSASLTYSIKKGPILS